MTDLPAFRTGRARRDRGYCRPSEGIEIPFAIVEGAGPGPCLVVTAGVHGSEYCSIEAALRLMALDPGALRGTLVVLPILNVGGFRARSIYVMPEDGQNLNRMFPGRADGTASQRLADWMMTRVFPEADAYLDLHGGDLDEALTPFTIFPADSAPSRAMAEAFGLPVGVAAVRGGNSIGGAAIAGVPAVLAEVGGNGIWTEDGVTLLVDGVTRVMRHLGMVDGPAPAPARFDVVSFQVPKAAASGFWYPTRSLCERVAPGDALGEIRDVFGAVLATVAAEAPGLVLYQLSSLWVNEGEALLGLGTPRQG